MTREFIQAKVTKTGSFDGTTHVDISAITGDWTVYLRVIALTGAARFEFQDAIVTDFTTKLTQKAFSVQGTMTDIAPVVLSYKKAVCPQSRFGVTSGELRLCLTDLTASGSVTYEAWLEY